MKKFFQKPSITVVPLVFLLFGMHSCQKKATTTTSSKVSSITSLNELKSIVDSAKGDLLILDLYADWCGPCKILSPIFDSLAEKNSGNASFYRINVDNNPDIASAFGVKGIPYVVFIKNQEAVFALSGFNPKQSYQKIISACGSNVSIQDCKSRLNNL